MTFFSKTNIDLCIISFMIMKCSRKQRTQCRSLDTLQIHLFLLIDSGNLDIFQSLKRIYELKMRICDTEAAAAEMCVWVDHVHVI